MVRRWSVSDLADIAEKCENPEECSPVPVTVLYHTPSQGCIQTSVSWIFVRGWHGEDRSGCIEPPQTESSSVNRFNLFDFQFKIKMAPARLAV